MDTSPTPPANPEIQTKVEIASRPRFPWAIVFFVFLLAVVTTTLVTFVLPESYSSTARVKIEPDRSDIRGLPEREVMTGYDPHFMQTEFEVMQSELVLENVISALNLNVEWGRKYAGGAVLKTSETIALLKGHMDLRPVRNTSLIEIRVFGESPDEAARIANMIAEVYRQYRQEEHEKLIRGDIVALMLKYKESNEKIRKIRAEITELSGEKDGRDTNRLEEAKRQLDEHLGYAHILFTRIANEDTAASIPAPNLAQILDHAMPNLRPVRPNKPFNIALGIIVGGVSGFILATIVFLLHLLEFRRKTAGPRVPLPPQFRTVAHILIALVVGLIIGRYCATPLEYSSFIIVPLSLFLGGIASAYIELMRTQIVISPGAPPKIFSKY
jgi:uncharacterized protein involved in exopolysaccharide biosynthesis